MEDPRPESSDLQWLEDSVNYLGSWIKDIVTPSKKQSESTIVEVPENKVGKISKRRRRKRRPRKIIRLREREVEIIVEDD